MEAKDPKHSVRDEQFSEPAENLKGETDDTQPAKSSKPAKEQDEKITPEKTEGSESKPVDTADNDSEGKNIPEKPKPEESDKSTEPPVSPEDSAEEDSEPASGKNKIEAEASVRDESEKKEDDSEDDQENKSGSVEQISAGDNIEEEKTGKEKTGDDQASEESTGDKSARKEEELKKQEEDKNKEIINYALLNKHDLLEIFKELLDEGRINEIGRDVAAIKTAFYKRLRAEHEEKKARFLKQGGNEHDYSAGISDEEETFKGLMKKYSDLRSEFNKLREEEKDENLKKKYEIIDGIKELVHRDESINKTFQEFRDLQRRWHEVGIVPQGELKNLWENYHYHVEKFYDYIKINKELRDLDLRKNLEAKLKLCENAEELLLEPNIVNAFKTLQKYHDQWREIGPVPKENRSDIWERFREATSKINKKHQHYYQDLKESQKQNLEEKTILCEKAEALADQKIEDHEGWVEKTREILDIQKVWKTIGFAPKKDNNRIYERFRTACDKFFDKKREFYAQGMEQQQENLQKKLDLCVQAETLQDSSDWKKTTDEMITLQKKWKKIGPAPRKKSDAVWKRFRAACDKFFNRKSDFFSNIEETYDKNLEEKEKLIKEIQDFKPGDSLKENLSKLNEFQRSWSRIGFVPYEKKDEIMQHYRDSINDKYDQLQLDEHKKNVLKFQNKLDAIKNKPRPENKLRFEREKLMNKLQQLRNDIVVWENNIGFFAESKKADSMVRDFEKKIESARKKIKLLEDKISMIDELDEQL